MLPRSLHCVARRSLRERRKKPGYPDQLFRCGGGLGICYGAGLETCMRRAGQLLGGREFGMAGRESVRIWISTGVGGVNFFARVPLTGEG